MMDINLLAIVLFLIVGAMAGLMAGMLGVGGGLVIVPALLSIFPLIGIHPDVVIKIAVGTSLATIIITSISSVRSHHKRRSVIWYLFWRMTPGIAVGAIIGAWLADFMPTDALEIIFGVFAVAVAGQMFFQLKPSGQQTEPGSIGLIITGTLIGSFSSLVGIGGGSLTVPFLTYWNTKMARAVGTSAACGLPLAMFGSAGFMVSGIGAEHLPTFSTGYVYWPAFIGICVTSIIFAPIGVKLAHKVSPAALKKSFAVFLFIIGSKILLF
jgi:uncharacterized protein